jgi:hypothetical protein
LSRRSRRYALPASRCRPRGSAARPHPPPHFAWLDHRLRDRLHDLSLEAIALLVFLHLAADRTGCSFWADATIAKKLGRRKGDVIQARDQLVAKGLVAYRYPLYQLLPLEDPRR